MENILTGNPNLKAVFASNDNMALGAVEALKAAGKLDEVMVVGFDANPDAAASDHGRRHDGLGRAEPARTWARSASRTR